MFIRIVELDGKKLIVTFNPATNTPDVTTLAGMTGDLEGLATRLEADEVEILDTDAALVKAAAMLLKQAAQ